MSARDVLASAMADQVGAKALSDEAVLAEYEANKVIFTRPSVNARHILLAKLTDADHVKKLLDAGGDFEALAEEYSPSVRARAFSVWVALFGCVTSDGTVTRNSTEVAEEFSVSRMSWKQYRGLLEEVGLIEQARVSHGTQRPTIVRVLPPLRK